MPAEIENPLQSTAAFVQLTLKHTLFNQECARQLEEMNKNVISNIISRGGNKGWTTAENLDDLTKSFHFDSFEAAQAFCQHVGKASNKIDHHPEWSLSNGGRTVEVKLTSHFAGNKVTRLDFQLAEAMNEAFTITEKTFSMFPWLTNPQWTSIKIAAGCIAFGMFWIRWMTRPQFVLKTLDKPDETVLEPYRIKTNAAYVQSRADEIADAQLDRYATRHIAQRQIYL